MTVLGDAESGSASLNSDEMGSKRPSSPLSATHDQPSKRIKSESPKQCLHCESPLHDWTECTAMCKQCGDSHPRRRCLVLGVETYVPGGFVICGSPARKPAEVRDEYMFPGEELQVIVNFPICVANQKQPFEDLRAKRVTSVDGINPTRAAMIAITPAPPSPPHRIIEKPGLGPMKSGTNTIPLGPKQPIGTSWPLPTPRPDSTAPSSTYAARPPPPPPKALIFSQAALHGIRDVEKEYEIWDALKLFIKTTVHNTAARSKKFNGLNDRKQVAAKVDVVLRILKPIITGDDPPPEGYAGLG